MEISIQEVLKAPPKLWVVNPLAMSQLESLVLQERLAAAEARIAGLEAPKPSNGVSTEAIPTKVESQTTEKR